MSAAQKKASLLLFLLPDCPVSNAYAPEIKRICSDYEPRGVGVFVVHADPDLTAEEAKKHAQEYQLPCPVLLDPTHVLVKWTGATMAPEAAVVGPDGKVLYLGRIDDLFVDYGKRRARAQATRFAQRARRRSRGQSRADAGSQTHRLPSSGSEKIAALAIPWLKGTEMRFCVVAFASLCLAAPGMARRRRQGKPPAPTYSKEVVTILHEQCVICHRPGEAAPFSLLTYEDAKKRGKLIGHVTQSKQMPPWKADPSDVPFRNERRLKDEQIAVLQRWVEAGMPEGDKAQVPPLPSFAQGWPLGKPDLVVKMPKHYKVAAEGRDVYRNFAISLGLQEDKWVKAIDFRPSAPSVLHHSLFFIDPTGTAAQKEAESGEVGTRGDMGGGQQGRQGAGQAANLLSRLRGGLLGGGDLSARGAAGLGGWAVGGQARQLPDGLAYKLPKGSDLILSTHFHPSGKTEEECSTVALYFADKPPVQRFMGIQVPGLFGALSGINIPAGKKDYTIEGSFELPVNIKAFGVSAHAHYLAKDFKLTATLPDGKTKTLLSISDWDFAWQEQYQFRDFQMLPKGTMLKLKITYDNSADNPHNPTDPPKRVRWGRESTDEMGSMSLMVVAAKEEDFPKLQAAYRRHIQDSLSGNR